MSYSHAYQDSMYSTVPVHYCMRRHDSATTRPGYWTVARFHDLQTAPGPLVSCYGFTLAVMDDYGNLVEVKP